MTLTLCQMITVRTDSLQIYPRQNILCRTCAFQTAAYTHTHTHIETWNYYTFCFYAVYVQLRLLFTSRIDNTCFGLTGHLQVYKLLSWRIMLLTIKLFYFCYVVASDCICYGKVVPVLNELNTTPWRCRGSGYIDPHFLDLGTNWRWMVSFTPRRFTPGKELPVPNV
jgi:hypothetical protein